MAREEKSKEDGCEAEEDEELSLHTKASSSSKVYLTRNIAGEKQEVMSGILFLKMKISFLNMSFYSIYSRRMQLHLKLQ